MAHELHAGTPMVSPAPIAPEERGSTHRERMQQDADLARLGGGMAIPLTLLTQPAGTAATDAGSIDHTQTPVGFSALLMGE